MGQTLIIAEKPTAADKIANALADGDVIKNSKRNVAYWEITRGGKNIVVAPAAGHLYSLRQKSKGWTYPVFDLEWAESNIVNKKASFSKPYLQNIKELAKKSEEFVCACDYDTEGSVIGAMVLKYGCNVEEARRMKFSTLTKEELIESYENASQTLDFPQIEAGETRHILDFYWGINTSRALTHAIRSATGHASPAWPPISAPIPVGTTSTTLN